MVLLNVGLYWAAFRVLTSGLVKGGELIPGSILGGAAFTLLITLGAGLVQHQLRNSSATYGALASVIGVVTFLLLLARVSVYAAELNPVVARHLWPRGLPTTDPSKIDLVVKEAAAAANQALRPLEPEKLEAETPEAETPDPETPEAETPQPAEIPRPA
jgi:uncharacterized BrkB/YihY/UPF0761 family membrane protein